MIALSAELKKLILELQNLPSLSKFSLAGGTSLALKYNHRKSIDIDFFCNQIIGLKGFKDVETEIKELYGDKVSSFVYMDETSDQFNFLRFFIYGSHGAIKIELLQNMKTLYENEVLENIRLISVKDIGLFKLISASNRRAKKDIYDLNYITDQISLIELYEELKKKKEMFNSKADKTIFDLGNYNDCLDDPSLLLAFEENKPIEDVKPHHSHDRLDIVDGNMNWKVARFNWRMKVRELFKHLEIEFPNK